MDILFKSRSLSRNCNSLEKARKKWGEECGTLVVRRLGEMSVAEHLGIVRSLPQAGCHPLTGNRSGQFSVKLKHPHRLVFTPANDPVPLKDDGGIDLERVTIVRIVEVVDYRE